MPVTCTLKMNNRRQFLKSCAASVATVGVAGILAPVTAPRNWQLVWRKEEDLTFDHVEFKGVKIIEAKVRVFGDQPVDLSPVFDPGPGFSVASQRFIAYRGRTVIARVVWR